MMGEKWPNRFSREFFIYLLRFAAAEPQTPPAQRRQLQHVAQYFIDRCGQEAAAAAEFSAGSKSKAGGKRGKAASGAQPGFYRDSLFAALLFGNFLTEDVARPYPPVD